MEGRIWREKTRSSPRWTMRGTRGGRSRCHPLLSPWCLRRRAAGSWGGALLSSKFGPLLRPGFGLPWEAAKQRVAVRAVGWSSTLGARILTGGTCSTGAPGPAGHAHVSARTSQLLLVLGAAAGGGSRVAQLGLHVTQLV